jgi:hypothetical protein
MKFWHQAIKYSYLERRLILVPVAVILVSMPTQSSRLLKPDRIDSTPPAGGLPISRNEIWMDANENRRGRRSLSLTVSYLRLRGVFGLLSATAAQAIYLERVKSASR